MLVASDSPANRHAQHSSSHLIGEARRRHIHPLRLDGGTSWTDIVDDGRTMGLGLTVEEDGFGSAAGMAICLMDDGDDIYIYNDACNG